MLRSKHGFITILSQHGLQDCSKNPTTSSNIQTTQIHIQMLRESVEELYLHGEL